MPMDNMVMGGGMGREMMEKTPDASTDSEMPSVFLSKKQLGGKTVKAGDMIQMKVLDVDPESGDVEVECSYGNDEGETKPGYESDFDAAMPDEGME